MAVSEFFGLLGCKKSAMPLLRAFSRNAQQRDEKAWKLLARSHLISLPVWRNCNKSDKFKFGQVLVAKSAIVKG